MHCRDCAKWICERRRHYGDGTAQLFYTAPEGKGHCDLLDLDTVPEFGCLSFIPGDHVQIMNIEGAPWECWTMIPCPDSNGTGVTPSGGVCRRCAGTGLVRRYDDGYIADQTWDHPLEKARKKELPFVEPVLRSIKTLEGILP